MDRFIKITDIKDAFIESIDDGVWLEKETTKNIIVALAKLPQVSFEASTTTTFVKYEDLLESSWPWCAGYGHCDNCPYGEDDHICGIYEWIKELPKYQMGMEKIK